MRLFHVTAFLALLLAFGGSSTSAQGVVPGGWDLEFGYQSATGLNAYGVNGLAGGFASPYSGYSFAGTGGFAPYGGATQNPRAFMPTVPLPAGNAGAWTAPVAPTVNTLGPFGNTIRRATRARRVR